MTCPESHQEEVAKLEVRPRKLLQSLGSQLSACQGCIAPKGLGLADAQGLF